jgi:hypothetical protein
LWLTIDIPNRYLHSWLDFATSEVTEPKVEGLGDLSLKHNLGVLLARLWGWHSVLFLDDDIDEVDEAAVWRGAAAVGVESMVGLSVDHFPDDSVACHVNWYSGGAQEILVSGLAPLVDCRQANSFFPEVYNEHWMFFRRGLVRRKVAATESVRQLECDPFADPDRAAKEEFGEVLAKGLTNLTHHSPGLELVALDLRDAAFHAEYWRWFLRARAEFIEKIGNRIANQPPSDASHSALLPLKVAHDRRSRLSTEQCAADLKTWESHTEDCGGGPLCSGPALFGRSWCLSASSSTRSRHSFDPA